MNKFNNGYGRMSDSENSTATAVSSSRHEEIKWEKRPGGMLVQQRTEKMDSPTLQLRLRITYGALQYEISVNSTATFGDVKKLLIAETRLQPDEQRLSFRGKVRENCAFLDLCGVKDRSKLMLVQDPCSIERRFIQMRRNAKIQSKQRAISDVSVEVDRLAEQVIAVEKSISNGIKVPQVQITTLTEMLMRQAIKLDSLSAEGDFDALKNLQAKRVQKSVETLDRLKITNATVKPVIVTTKWETFDPSPPHANTKTWIELDTLSLL